MTITRPAGSEAGSMPPNHYLHIALKLLQFDSVRNIIVRGAKTAMTPRPKELYSPRDASDTEIDERSVGTHNPVTVPEDQSVATRTSYMPQSLEDTAKLVHSEDPGEQALGQTLQCYQMQLMLLEQQYKRYKSRLEQERKASESASS
ncbi:hypothetical protein APSETT444_005982 [Aspergillus pseudonomiae]